MQFSYVRKKQLHMLHDVNQTEIDGSFIIETGHAPKLIMANLKLNQGRHSQESSFPRLIIA
jgi:hypothetical protein